MHVIVHMPFSFFFTVFARIYLINVKEFEQIANEIHAILSSSLCVCLTTDFFIYFIIQLQLNLYHASKRETIFSVCILCIAITTSSAWVL